ncbi:MAG: flagellar protein FlaG [Acidobacteriaceae bacterium]|jgi:flagellar protein FlaG|nr:flagellar protein FlaG [Acidobacteriaceae bacterium]
MEPKSIQSSPRVPAPAPPDLERQQLEERKELVRAVKAINESAAFGENYELTFVFDRPNQRTLVRIIDRETKEVIRQLPAEYALRVASQLGKD